MSFNAQHAIGAPAAFVVYGVINATEAAPLSGPTQGDTLVTFGGSGFSNGSDCRCRFGDGLEVDERCFSLWLYLPWLYSAWLYSAWLYSQHGSTH